MQVSETNDWLLACTFYCIIQIAIFICKRVATIIAIEKFSSNNLTLKCPQNQSQSIHFSKIFWGGMPPDPPSISMLRMLVAAPPQFHYTLFCPPSAKILKETLSV